MVSDGLLGAVSRPLLAAMFVYGGLDSLRHPATKVAPAERVTRPLSNRLPLPDDTELLVRVNGGVQVAAGLLLGTGQLKRLSALALAGSLVLTTAAGHRFWDEPDPGRRAQQRIHFLKNLSMLGGLLATAGG